MEDLRDILNVLSDEKKWRTVEQPERAQPKGVNVSEDWVGYATGMSYEAQRRYDRRKA